MTFRIPEHVTTISQLYKQDLEQAYLLFVFPSSYEKRLRLLNKNKYQIYDNPPSKKSLLCHASVTGDYLPVLIDNPPPEFLKHHWKAWLPSVFAPAKCLNVDEGLKVDGIPVVTIGAFEEIPPSKHCINPDTLHRLQSKNCIPKIGVPCPRYMDEANLEYPCVIKPDSGHLGHGIFKAENYNEMLSFMKELRGKNSWKGQVVYQEFIEDIKEVRSHLFYVTKSCEVIWLGTNFPFFQNKFTWSSMEYDWLLQDLLRDADYDTFVIPISKYLHDNGYFGPVNIEIVMNEQGSYLVDLNVRLGNEAAHHLIAPYMAKKGLTFSYLLHIPSAKDLNKRSPKELVERANRLNETSQHQSCIIVCGLADDEDDNFESTISVYGKCRQDCDAVFEKLKE